MVSETTFDRWLVRCVLGLAFIVVVLGAYVRLSDVGLGCPDWPGCYGQLLAPTAEADRLQALESYPHAPVEVAKAWKEMVHRYLAGLLGLLIGLIAVRAWLGWSGERMLATVLLLLVVFQAALGMWTVTLLLKPVIVMAHLLGGMATLSLILLLGLRRSWRPGPGLLPGWLAAFGLFGLLLLIGQIALGGWTSSNYAALACLDLPTCQGEWWPEMAFYEGFHLVRDLGLAASGHPLSHEALVAIHLSHRIGAVVTAAVLGVLGLVLLSFRGQPGRMGAAVLVLVVVQFLLGLSNIWFVLPLPVAVAHNGGAALLLLSMVAVNFGLLQGWCGTRNV
ncbi:MAG: COX15/CtaA family protein [Gammaproteobacteria bacterium]|nr:COX15/CtaA family protein [Gammaproteobacteria bacterium]